ncbi:Piwi domain-containing protein, partial [Phaeosphaeriaceae sp. PMI808]
INQYMGNIMMKTNLKFGGQNHDAVIRLQTAEKGKFKNLSTSEQMQHTLVLGADVTHPSPSSIQYCPSVASVVGSVGCGSGKFLGSMRLQQGKQEIIEALEPMVFERVIDWAKGNHGRIPVNVLYYRDGVDEGQYGKVKNKEVPQITAALRRAAKELKKSPKEISELESNLKITAIVVAKRHHTRFFPQNNQQRESRGGNNNTRPGLIVEHTVTSPYYTDFYLQSHSGLKGTVKPTHYFFLQNDLGWSLANIMTFTQGLCYTYVRSTIGVSYASPTYYADRLCERGR